MYNPQKMGRAQYGSWAELTDTQVATITASEGTDTLPLSAQRFASLVYQVNPSPVQLSGAVFDIGDVGIVDPITQQETIVDSGGNLHVYDNSLETAINNLSSKLNIVSNSKIISANGGFTYIADAIPGSLSGSSVWRIKRIDANGTTTWADGNANFDNAATDFAALTFTL